MTTKRITTVLAVLGGLFLLYIGIGYLAAPQSMAEGFGLTTITGDEGTGFLRVKGDRDVTLGLVIFALLFAGQRKALGWAMAAMTVAPLSDMLLVLDEGSAATAFSVHGSAAVVVALTAGLLLRERADAPQTAAPQTAAA
ncbi:DUF4267 domain-containing protein [Yinghuangia soli]|uniref:DUF4267 domain-containing protein n=1 Tax=Yinghuangia soli TaxID=2908204 RepID=A0AA41Q434_9ACTN|nr:DUF4267 domain-containing protein [Yinghuangia soli]MCF2530064.1 DUF4267 domain-containing protein [Yinghuangia soli]